MGYLSQAYYISSILFDASCFISLKKILLDDTGLDFLLHEG